MPAHPSANLDWTTAAQLLLFYINISAQAQPSSEGGDADKEVDEELGYDADDWVEDRVEAEATDEAQYEVPLPPKPQRSRTRQALQFIRKYTTTLNAPFPPLTSLKGYQLCLHRLVRSSSLKAS